MMDLPSWLKYAAWVAAPITLGLVGLGVRALVKSYVEGQVQHGFAKSMEAVRAELRKTEEALKSDLRVKEAEISALQGALLSGRTQRLALLDKRRIEAVENIWFAVTELSAMKNLSAVLATLKLEKWAERSAHEPKLREFMKSLTCSVSAGMLTISQRTAKDRPFVSPLAWAYCLAYVSTCQYYYAYAKVIEIGVKDMHKAVSDEHLLKILKAAFPHAAEHFDGDGSSRFYYLLEPLEALLFEELKRNLEDASIDEKRTKQAKAIMAAINEKEAKETAAKISTPFGD